MIIKTMTLQNGTHFEYIPHTNPNAETVLLVHGLGLDMSTWDDVVPLLSEQYHVLRYDLPGHGHSTSSKIPPITWDFLMAHVKELLNYLSIKNVHFVGHSGGGNFGMEIALQGHDWLQSLTIISTPILVPSEMGKKEVAERFSKLESKNYSDVINPLISSLCYPATREKKAKLRAMYTRVSEDTYFHYLRLFSATVFTYTVEKLVHIKVPMMMLIGERDTLYPPKLQLLNLPYLTNIRYFIIPDSANALMMDMPDLTVEYLQLFMKKIDSIAASGKYKYEYTDELEQKLLSIIKHAMYHEDNLGTIQLSIMDGFKVVIDGKEVEGKWNQRKARQIFTYAALHQEVTREKLIDIFWPDQDLGKARGNLRVSLNHIKTIIEDATGNPIEHYFTINRETISIRGKLKIDLSEFIQELTQIEGMKNTKEKTNRAKRLANTLPKTLFPTLYDEWINEIRLSIEDRLFALGQEGQVSLSHP